MKANQHITMFIMHNDVMVRCVISGEYKEYLTTMGWSESSEDLVKNDTRVEKAPPEGLIKTLE